MYLIKNQVVLCIVRLTSVKFKYSIFFFNVVVTNRKFPGRLHCEGPSTTGKEEKIWAPRPNTSTLFHPVSSKVGEGNTLEIFHMTVLREIRNYYFDA